MPHSRAAVTLIAIMAGAVWPVAAAAAGTPIPRLSATPPPWLPASSAPAPGVAAPTVTTAATTSASTTTTTTAGLPKTGSDLRTEAILALGLLAAGGALRRRRA